MRRVPGLVDISRRDFCRLAGCAGALAIGGCFDSGPGAVQTGELGGGGNGHDADGGSHDSGTGSGSQHDAATTVACTTTPTDVGPASGYTLGTPQYFSSGNFFVVKDAMGFYALTAVCTHEGATTQWKNNDEFYCPRHGATFDVDGNPKSGPVFIGLVHYAMCDMGNGHLGVIKSQQVSQSTRLAG